MIAPNAAGIDMLEKQLAGATYDLRGHRRWIAIAAQKPRPVREGR